MLVKNSLKKLSQLLNYKPLKLVK